ncbi:MAG: hypothetical protein GC161_13140 [Planctomycetaceae bacterium]|nr:hypothetical protein [Planctomycetaceae bacterium]
MAPSATLATLFEQRRWALLCDQRSRAFFCDLDVRVHPGLVSASDAARLDEASQLLFNRLEARIALGRRSLVPDFRAPAGGFVSRQGRNLAWVSDLLRSLHDEHLVLQGGSSLMAWAIEAFALGHLSTFHLDPDLQEPLSRFGAPNSSEFLKFPELALACLDYDVDRAFWAAHLESFVRAAHLFVALAGPIPAGTARLVGCRAMDFRPGRWISAGDRGAIHRDVAADAGDLELLAARFTRLMASTFQDTVVGAVDARAGVVPPR